MFNTYPYTDFHEINLDWFLTEFFNVKQHVDDLDATVREFTEFVTNYFDNLDVQEEINEKLTAMAESGELAALMQPYIAQNITDWLNENIEPTSPPVDSSLTVSGAAADAKTVGDIFKYTPYIKFPHSTDLDDLVDVGIYGSASGSTNVPSGESANLYIVVVFPDSSNANRVSQLYFGILSNKIYVRNRDTQLAWGSWYEVTSWDLTNRALISARTHSTNLDDLTTIGIYHSLSGSTNVPTGESANFYLLMVIPDISNSARVTQIYIGLLTNNIWLRQRNTQSTWEAWKKIQDANSAYITRSIATGSDLNDIVTTGFYFGSGSVAVLNAPDAYMARNAFLLTVYQATDNNTRVYQTITCNSNGNMFYRERMSTGTWTGWQLIGKGKIYIQPIDSNSWRVYFGKYNTRLYHTVNTNTNSDLWNILSIQYNTQALCSVGTDILGPIREKGQADFMGGVHGNEIADHVIIRADGKTADLTQDVICDELDISVESRMFRVSDPTVPVLKRVLNAKIAYNKIEVTSVYTSLIDGLIIDRCTNGGLIAMGNTWLQSVRLGDQILESAPTVNDPQFTRGNVDCELFWESGSFRMENLIGHELDTYSGAMFTYPNESPIRNKIYFNTIESENGVTLNTGDTITGKFRYTFK